MGAKKSNPDARTGRVPSIGAALNNSGSNATDGMKPTFIFNELNKASTGGKTAKPMKAIDGTYDVKTDVAIPTVKEQTNRVNKQMKDNDRINKKYRGDD